MGRLIAVSRANIAPGLKHEMSIWSASTPSESNGVNSLPQKQLQAELDMFYHLLQCKAPHLSIQLILLHSGAYSSSFPFAHLPSKDFSSCPKSRKRLCRLGSADKAWHGQYIEYWGFGFNPDAHVTCSSFPERIGKIAVGEKPSKMSLWL
jgi:hypothetical protein